MTLHPAVRVPMLILGGLAIVVGLAALLLAMSAGARAGGLLWRGALSLLIGVLSTVLGRRAGRSGDATP